MWTREQAIRDVMEASDGFGREHVDKKGAVIQPCIYELAYRLRMARRREAQRLLDEARLRRELGGVLPGEVRCARPGCPEVFRPSETKKKLYCSNLCGKREQGRRANMRRRARRERAEQDLAYRLRMAARSYRG